MSDCVDRSALSFFNILYMKIKKLAWDLNDCFYFVVFT